MVRFDSRFAFKNVGPDCALSKEFDAVEFTRFLSEYFNEFAADNHSLLLGIGNARKLVKESVNSVNIYEIRLHLVAENLLNLFGLALSEQTVVYVNGNKLIAHRFDKQGGYNR